MKKAKSIVALILLAALFSACSINTNNSGAIDTTEPAVINKISPSPDVSMAEETICF